MLKGRRPIGLQQQTIWREGTRVGKISPCTVQDAIQVIVEDVTGGINVGESKDLGVSSDACVVLEGHRDASGRARFVQDDGLGQSPNAITGGTRDFHGGGVYSLRNRGKPVSAIAGIRVVVVASSASLITDAVALVVGPDSNAFHSLRTLKLSAVSIHRHAILQILCSGGLRGSERPVAVGSSIGRHFEISSLVLLCNAGRLILSRARGRHGALAVRWPMLRETQGSHWQR